MPKHVTNTRTINGKPLSSDISVTITDIPNLSATLSAKADLIAGEIPVDQLPDAKLDPEQFQVKSGTDLIQVKPELLDGSLILESIPGYIIGQEKVLYTNIDGTFEWRIPPVYSPGNYLPGFSPLLVNDPDVLSNGTITEDEGVITATSDFTFLMDELLAPTGTKIAFKNIGLGEVNFGFSSQNTDLYAATRGVRITELTGDSYAYSAGDETPLIPNIPKNAYIVLEKTGEDSDPEADKVFKVSYTIDMGVTYSPAELEVPATVFYLRWNGDSYPRGYIQNGSKLYYPQIYFPI